MRIVVSVAAVLLIVAIVVFSFLHKTRSNQVKTEFKTTDELMQYLANQAVEDAQKGSQVKLDYSVESIESVEKILGTLHEQYVKDNSSLSANGLAMAYGAYIGESIRKSDPICVKGSGCKWERDHPVAGEKSYPFHWGGGESFPCAWAFHRITQGPEDNVWHKYLALSQTRSDALNEAKKSSKP